MAGVDWITKGLDRKQQENAIRPTSSSLLKIVDNEYDYID